MAIVLLLVAICPLIVFAQSCNQLPSGDFPSMNTPGGTNPAAVSDLNAQLIWLMAVSPAAKDTPDQTAARSEYQRIALGSLGTSDQAKLSSILQDFRSRHDGFAADYNALIPTISRDDVWREYRDFRVKVNDLVAETIRSLNDAFPDSAARLHTAIEEGKRSINLTTYKSSVDTDYATSSRAATTGFAMIQGVVTGSGSKKSAASYATAVIVGMVPGCPGKVVPMVLSASGQQPVEGPPMHKWQYVNFQYTTRTAGSPGIGIMVNCVIQENE